MAQPPATAYEGTFDALYGLEVLEVGEELARGRVAVRDAVKQPAGMVHGGVYASMAEALASLATWRSVVENGKSATGLANATSFLRPISEGSIHATARRRHRGRTTWIWDVEITDDANRLCALTRMTIAVRPARVEPPQGISRRTGS